MFRISFDQNVVENVEEYFFDCAHVNVNIGLCTQLVSMRAHDSCVCRLPSCIRIHILQFTLMHNPTCVHMWSPCVCKHGPACVCWNLETLF